MTNTICMCECVLIFPVSCSKADPQGSDCIPEFRGMQNCFLEHPEEYGEFTKEEEEGEEGEGEQSKAVTNSEEKSSDKESGEKNIEPNTREQS